MSHTHTHYRKDVDNCREQLTLVSWSLPRDRPIQYRSREKKKEDGRNKRKGETSRLTEGLRQSVVAVDQSADGNQLSHRA